MIDLNYDTVVKLAREQIALKGEDHVYEKRERRDGVGTCLYVHNNQPDCIVGCILHAAGVGLDTLSQFEGNGVWTVIRKLEDRGVLKYDTDTSHFLVSLQGEQDFGATWGKALYWALSHKN